MPIQCLCNVTHCFWCLHKRFEVRKTQIQMYSWISELSFHKSVLGLLSVLRKSTSFVHLLLLHSHSHHLDVIFLQDENKFFQPSTLWIKVLLLFDSTGVKKRLEDQARIPTSWNSQVSLNMSWTQSPGQTIGPPETERCKWAQRGGWITAGMSWVTKSDWNR